jgi:P27 family predicted phage terminase small subunit
MVLQQTGKNPMGRLPKPARIKMIEGNRSKIAVAKLKSDPQGLGPPRLPPGLSEAEELLWLDVVASLPDGILSSADDGILERYVVAWARFRDARKRLAETGTLVKSVHGPVRNPLLIVISQATREMHMAGSELGLSPVSRARLAALDTFQDDPMALLLGGAFNDNRRDDDE